MLTYSVTAPHSTHVELSRPEGGLSPFSTESGEPNPGPPAPSPEHLAGTPSVQSLTVSHPLSLQFFILKQFCCEPQHFPAARAP